MNILELAILKKMVGGGGGSGTDNYNDLSNLPQINGETLAGNKTAENLGLQDALTFDSAPTEDSANPVKSGGVYNALAGKQDNLTFDGVYNASTNKAATESTVTNAIAGLDVSALSVDADETISSISETDGKISVTKQDIAIASNQVVSMAGYTKPSSAPATPAIQQGDTANAAFGKLEYKADVNQTNIWYAINNGMANALVIPDQTQTSGSLTLTIQDGVAKITGTSASQSQATKFVVAAHINLKAGTYYLSGGTGGTFGENFIRLGKQSGDTYIMANADNTKSAFTLTEDTECQFTIWAQGTNLNLTFYPMISPFSDIDFKRTLPNSDLTGLEAEDRAALAEVVDSGAKNLSSWNGGSLSTAGFIVRDYPITLTPGNYVIAYRTTATEGNTQLTLNSVAVVTLPNSNENRRVGFFTVDTTKTNFSLYSDSSNNTITDFMICTKAAFDVSPAYAPYRKNLDQLEATKAPALDTGAGVDSGSLDDVSENAFAIYTTNVSNLPTNTSYYYVETIVYSTDSSGYAIQKAYSVTDGASYIRVKNTGTWSAWKQITNA